MENTQKNLDTTDPENPPDGDSGKKQSAKSLADIHQEYVLSTETKLDPTPVEDSEQEKSMKSLNDVDLEHLLSTVTKLNLIVKEQHLRLQDAETRLSSYEGCLVARETDEVAEIISDITNAREFSLDCIATATADGLENIATATADGLEKIVQEQFGTKRKGEIIDPMESITESDELTESSSLKQDPSSRVSSRRSVQFIEGRSTLNFYRPDERSNSSEKTGMDGLRDTTLSESNNSDEDVGMIGTGTSTLHFYRPKKRSNSSEKNGMDGLRETTLSETNMSGTGSSTLNVFDRTESSFLDRRSNSSEKTGVWARSRRGRGRGRTFRGSVQVFFDSILSDNCTEKEYNRLIQNGDAPTYPEDCYSFIALGGPIALCYGLLVFLIQVTFLGLLLSQTWTNENVDDTPSGSMFPANVSYRVQATQVIAVISFLVFADASLKDCAKGIEHLPSFDKAKSRKNAFWMGFVCAVRFIQGFMAILASLSLILISDDIIEIILNFTAVNFVSTLDDCAYELASWGKWGPALKREAKRIQSTPLPYYSYHKRQSIRHLYTLFLTGMVMLSFLIHVIYMQEFSDLWTTHILRVQFEESNGLELYNGCYEMDPNIINHKRHNYNSYVNNTENATFGYCKRERRWVLFADKGFKVDPCNVSQEIAYSGKTADYDIIATFDGIWWSSSGSPLSVYFFESEGLGNKSELHCDSFLKNGKCDDSFNNAGFNFDYGDCCASTCSHPFCGLEVAEGAFGSNGTAGIAFPYCEDPTMVPVTIFLNKFSNSREFSGATDDQVKEYNKKRGKNFWEEIPQKPLLDVDCDGVNILSLYLDDNMENESETIFVNDGADCEVVISNMTDSSFLYDSEPIWWVNFTIYHGKGRTKEIISGYSGNEKETSFKLIPVCLLDKLKDIIDISSAYTANTTSTNALLWLQTNFQCDDPFLIERFALAVMNFAAPIKPLLSNSTLWIKSDQQCQWSQEGVVVTCDNDEVVDLRIENQDLDGTIPTLIGLLSNGLKHLDYDGNGLYGTIPSEIGLLTALKDLDLDKNKLTGTIPTQLGFLTKLTALDLDRNNLTGSIPSEIGLMPSLIALDMKVNNLIDSIPIEIYALTKLDFIDLGDNNMTGGIPSEVGRLGDVTELNLHNNSFSGPIPTEIGLMTSLVELDISWNFFAGTIPSEIGNQKNLEVLSLESNQLTGTIPSEITSLDGLQNLTELNLHNNSFSGLIPTEIGLMTSLVKLDLSWNFFAGTIPSEIGNLKNLKILNLEGNQLTGMIPSQIISLNAYQNFSFDKDALIESTISPTISPNTLVGENDTLIESTISPTISPNTLVGENNSWLGEIAAVNLPGGT